ncbi:uncharacterized protein BJ171DRAFT_495426 [Polychytrium aggregatum]|uniref:uncharacterized protein n=1 Tax=Polychytrium aggregatum TaxID=110093 RepID=UPI0022FE12D7|nr:uncharacterized protein BJ171DRAFT_495426 [Polychytrium aggregatum]KAI9207005.1 hypothetical protein BJ171DRAFT_495426 [Polychytrium aggregatum]
MHSNWLVVLSCLLAVLGLVQGVPASPNIGCHYLAKSPEQCELVQPTLKREKCFVFGFRSQEQFNCLQVIDLVYYKCLKETADFGEFCYSLDVEVLLRSKSLQESYS